MILLFTSLLFVHYLLDYPLQGDFLSKAKNKFNPIPHVPWYQAMAAHTFMHGFAVAMITQVPFLGLLEIAVHWTTDYYKCKEDLTFNQDQYIHIGSKLLWTVIAIYVGVDITVSI